MSNVEVLARLGRSDTIAAVATAAGRGAIALVRISGADAWSCAGRVCVPWSPEAQRAAYVAVRRPQSLELIDRCVVLPYRGPRSFTGEDMVELSLHGGPVTSALVMNALVEAGARPALAGEFTRRAVWNGKLDLLQAEGIADLIDAESPSAQRQASRQIEGSLSARIEGIRESVLRLEALIAYEVDFPEEDSGPVDPTAVEHALDAAMRHLDELLGTVRTGELIRRGALTVIAGPPNVGKSSLFNALLGRERALVAPIPGTTRDAIEALVDIDGYPVRMMDTAGMRSSEDMLERMGIEVARQHVASADVVLACGEDDQQLAEFLTCLATVTEGAVLAVRTKADLSSKPPVTLRVDSITRVSVRTGEGLAHLVSRLRAVLAGLHTRGDGTMPVVTRERHRAALVTARDELVAFRDVYLCSQAVPAVVAGTHLRAAITALEELVGVVTPDDVLDRVFASFCIGK